MLNVVNESKEIITGLDSVTIQKWISGIKGGRTLTIDSTFPLSVIHAGHVIITKDGVYKPMPVTNSTEQLPTAAESSQTAGSAISGTVYVEVEATTEGAVKCAFSNGTIIYLNGTKATGNAVAGTKYYTKDTSNKTTVNVYDANGDEVYEYGSLPSNFSYAGVLYRSILASKPAASIMFNGEVNSETIPYPMTSILSAFSAACPNITFIKDEIAE